jgi:hypothetical protein
VPEIAVFDFLSHENMHHAFNEGFVRVLRAAWPEDRIVFHARAGHIANLAPRLSDVGPLRFQPAPPFQPPFGLSRHNPAAGHWAARRCRSFMAQAIANRPVRLAALLGVDSNLWAVAGCFWPRLSPAPLHMILHGQLGDAMIWRSRNPLVRAFDMVAQLRRKLPAQVRLVTLELGVADAIAAIAPALRPALATLEHPVLVSEWPQMAPRRHPAMRIGFLGHARRAKGYQVFVELARQGRRPALEFHAIGLSSPETDHLDAGALTRRPTAAGLARQDYLRAVAELDLVCLPLHSRAYDFTASGTVSDAIAALKPLLAFRNRTLDAIVAKYGEIGYLVDSRQELDRIVRELDRGEFQRQLPAWQRNLAALRDARRPESLGAAYAALLAPAAV